MKVPLGKDGSASETPYDMLSVTDCSESAVTAGLLGLGKSMSSLPSGMSDTLILGTP